MRVWSLLLVLHGGMVDGKGRVQMSPDGHHPDPSADYGEHEARAAFERVARDHGWRT